VDPEDPNWSSPLDRNGLFGYGHPSRLPTQLPPGADGDGGTGTVPCGIQRAPIRYPEGVHIMPIGEVCVRDVVVVSKEQTIQQAAVLMRRNHVGDLVVVEERAGGRQVPVGIVTDRDIVVSVLATAVDPQVYTVGDLVARKLLTVAEDQGVFETIQYMRTNGVRRMPVVDRAGGLVGIISVDDLIQLLSDEMSELAKLIAREQVHEAAIKR